MSESEARWPFAFLSAKMRRLQRKFNKKTRRIAALEEDSRRQQAMSVHFNQETARFDQELTRCHAEMITRQNAIWQKLDTLEDDIIGGRLSELSQEIGYIWERLVSAEHEFRDFRNGGQQRNSVDVRGAPDSVGFASPTQSDIDRTARAEPRILNPDKLKAARLSRLRVNLNCATIPLDDFINIDGQERVGVDVVADLEHLPIEKDSVAEFFSAHLLQLLPQQELQRRILPYWVSLLTPGGLFRAIVPDGKAMLEAVASADYTFEELRSALFDETDDGQGLSRNLFTPETLTRLLTDAGLIDVKVTLSARRNGSIYEFEVVARRPERWVNI